MYGTTVNEIRQPPVVFNIDGLDKQQIESKSAQILMDGMNRGITGKKLLKWAERKTLKWIGKNKNQKREMTPAAP